MLFACRWAASLIIDLDGPAMAADDINGKVVPCYK